MGLPATNVQSVFTQMQADRQKYIDQLLAEGERDAQIIMSESDAEVAAIVAEGREEDPAIQALVAALESDAVKTFMEETYGGAVVPVF